jgi:hypothetical protein
VICCRLPCHRVLQAGVCWILARLSNRLGGGRRCVPERCYGRTIRRSRSWNRSHTQSHASSGLCQTWKLISVCHQHRLCVEFCDPSRQHGYLDLVSGAPVSERRVSRSPNMALNINFALNRPVFSNGNPKKSTGHDGESRRNRRAVVDRLV